MSENAETGSVIKKLHRAMSGKNHGSVGSSADRSDNGVVNPVPARSKSANLGLRKPGKGSVVFVLSITVGLAGAFFSRKYIENRVDFYREQLVQPEKMVQIVVPKMSLRRGQALASELLSLRSIPEKYADSNALSQHNFTEAIGQQLAFDVDEGRPLLWAHLEGGRSPTFSGMVPKGSRALTVRVDEINSISGFLQPQDRIDLLMTYGSGTSNVVFPLLQEMIVIATGVQTQVVKNGDLASKRAFSTITINVTPEEAQKITLAQKIGKLTAVLRNPEDSLPLANTPMTTARLFNKKKKVISKPKTVPKRKETPKIEYIIGGV